MENREELENIHIRVMQTLNEELTVVINGFTLFSNHAETFVVYKYDKFIIDDKSSWKIADYLLNHRVCESCDQIKTIKEGQTIENIFTCYDCINKDNEQDIAENIMDFIPYGLRQYGRTYKVDQNLLEFIHTETGLKYKIRIEPNNE